MTGITSTELKLPRLRNWVWIGVIIVGLFICVAPSLLPNLSFDYLVENPVATAVHMIPRAELRYNDTIDRNSFMTVKRFIYWINSPFDQVKDYQFVTNFRQSSDPNKLNIFSTVTPNLATGH